METRVLGRTGHASSVAILGAAMFWQQTPEVTEAALDLALDRGVNHLDIAPQYGEAQRLVGPFLPARRHRMFVACKTLRKQADGVRAQLEESLQLLGCDGFDLYQMHAVTSVEDLDERDGAARTILRARDEGLTRFAGITGHDLGAPAAHLEALRRYDLDTVMFPVNPRMWADPQYRRNAEALLAHCVEHDIGVMAIKAGAARPWGDRPHTADTWYEPYADESSLRRGIGFALSVPGVHAFCTPGEVTLLATVLDVAERYERVDLDSASAEVAFEGMIFPIPA